MNKKHSSSTFFLSMKSSSPPTSACSRGPYNSSTCSPCTISIPFARVRSILRWRTHRRRGRSSRGREFRRRVEGSWGRRVSLLCCISIVPASTRRILSVGRCANYLTSAKNSPSSRKCEGRPNNQPGTPRIVSVPSKTLSGWTHNEISSKATSQTPKTSAKQCWNWRRGARLR